MLKVDQQVGASTSTGMMHVFDREGEIAEVLEQVCQLKPVGIVVRAADDRSLNPSSGRVWAKLKAQLIQLYQDIDISQMDTQAARTAKVAV